MRIVIDLQGAQTESRFRGIGRYALSLAKAMAQAPAGHEIWIALNGALTDSIGPLCKEFAGLVPPERICVFDVPGAVAEQYTQNSWRARAAEPVRELFLERLKPDVILVTSLFEGFGDDAVTSLGTCTETRKTAVILYDLIPYLDQARYLADAHRRDYYLRKLDYLRKAGALLAISGSARAEGVEALGFAPDHVTNISSAISDVFKPADLSTAQSSALLSRYGVTRKMVLYAPGGFDVRKNCEGLIDAYARLPQALRATHQLVIASRIHDGDKARLLAHKASAGLQDDELILTGYLPDEDLIGLYSLATLFVFPSRHEGFGLPVLEAMACGAPAIGSNTTSVPEVIGWSEALFDPDDISTITALMTRALTDADFLNALRENARSQAPRFSWPHSARVAIEALEALYERNGGSTSVNSQTAPLPRERQLLVDISEVVGSNAHTGVQRVVRRLLRELLLAPPPGWRVVPVHASRETGYRYARQFMAGFSPDHAVEGEDTPVVARAGDLFLALDMQHHVQLQHESWLQALREQGVPVYFVVHDLLPVHFPQYFGPGIKALHEQWLAMIARMDGAVCVSRYTAKEFEHWVHELGNAVNPDFEVSWSHNGADIKMLDEPEPAKPRTDALQQAMGSRPTFLMVGTLEPRKGHADALKAFDALWQSGIEANLVIVGVKGWGVDDVVSAIGSHPQRDKQLFWLEGADDALLQHLYQTASCLIAASLAEGFGLPLIEAAQHGLPVIASDIDVFREVADEGATYFAAGDGDDLARVILAWLPQFAEGKHTQSANMKWISWAQSAAQLCSLILPAGQVEYPQLVEALKRINAPVRPSERDLEILARAVVTAAPADRRRQLLVDISELHRRDARSGIQRVVRNVLAEWLTDPPAGFVVRPVYAELTNNYRYADGYGFRGSVPSMGKVRGELVECSPGDIFFGLDMQPQVTIRHQDCFEYWRQRGVMVKFALYDLLPIRMPEAFTPGTSIAFTQWLKTISRSDGIVCDSRTVAEDLESWLSETGTAVPAGFKVSWSHIGADMGCEVRNKTLPPHFTEKLALVAANPYFLTVGTIEPRKGHEQALKAFELLWQKGIAANLVIVGKAGWLADDLVKALRGHPEAGRRLFWLEGLDDGCLDALYRKATCLLAPSYGEGFGLPLIEAAQYNVPILARDLPVFREVAGTHATYFSGTAPAILAQAVEDWLDKLHNGLAPQSTGMAWLTWAQCAKSFWRAIQSPDHRVDCS